MDSCEHYKSKGSLLRVTIFMIPQNQGTSPFDTTIEGYIWNEILV